MPLQKQKFVFPREERDKYPMPPTLPVKQMKTGTENAKVVGAGRNRAIWKAG